MPNFLLGKNLHSCFTPIQRPQLQQTPAPTDLTRSCTTTTTTAMTSSASFSAFFKNYNSLYDFAGGGHPDDRSPSSSTVSEDRIGDPDDTPMSSEAPPDLAALHASRRFFFSSPGRSNSIIDSSSSSSSLLDDAHLDQQPVPGGIAVQTYSPDPYTDFRRSMQEMVTEGRRRDDHGDWDWEYLHELLVCYLKLNPKNAHGYIIRAFADVIVDLFAADCGGDRRGGGGGECDFN